MESFRGLDESPDIESLESLPVSLHEAALVMPAFYLRGHAPIDSQLELVIPILR